MLNDFSGLWFEIDKAVESRIWLKNVEHVHADGI